MHLEDRRQREMGFSGGISGSVMGRGRPHSDLVCSGGMLLHGSSNVLRGWMPSLPAGKGRNSELGVSPGLVTLLCSLGKVKSTFLASVSSSV